MDDEHGHRADFDNDDRAAEGTAQDDQQPETPADMSVETPADVSPDTPADVQPETPADVSPDTPADLSVDTLADVQPDTPADMSLEQLRDAFSEMLTLPDSAEPPEATGAGSDEGESVGLAMSDGDQITPQSIIEAMLFVGSVDGSLPSSERIATIIHGVEPEEVDKIVEELNREYTAAGCPFEISGTGAGYRLSLRDEFGRMHDKFLGPVRRARLSQAAIEVLALVAYSQPLTTEQVTKFRGKPSGQVLAQLVRRQLLRIERPDDKAKNKLYCTTQRFLDLFGLENLDQLPQSRELDLN